MPVDDTLFPSISLGLPRQTLYLSSRRHALSTDATALEYRSELGNQNLRPLIVGRVDVPYMQVGQDRLNIFCECVRPLLPVLGVAPAALVRLYILRGHRIEGAISPLGFLGFSSLPTLLNGILARLCYLCSLVGGVPCCSEAYDRVCLKPIAEPYLSPSPSASPLWCSGKAKIFAGSETGSLRAESGLQTCIHKPPHRHSAPARGDFLIFSWVSFPISHPVCRPPSRPT